MYPDPCQKLWRVVRRVAFGGVLLGGGLVMAGPVLMAEWGRVAGLAAMAGFVPLVAGMLGYMVGAELETTA